MLQMLSYTWIKLKSYDILILFYYFRIVFPLFKYKQVFVFTDKKEDQSK